MEQGTLSVLFVRTCTSMHTPGPCILGGWPFRVDWTSVGTAIAPKGSLWHILL